MPLWGNKKEAVKVDATTLVETTDGAPIGTYVHVRAGGGPNAHFGNTSGTRAKTDLDMFKANAPFPTMPNMKVSVLPVTAADINAPNGSVLTQTISVPSVFAGGDPGDNYSGTVYANVVFANGYVAVDFLQATITGGGVQSLQQRVPSPRGTVYNSPITAIQVAPSPDLAIKVANNLGFNSVTDQILYPGADQVLQSQDEVDYIVPPGNTAIRDLTAGRMYLKNINGNGFQLRDTPTDPGTITISDTRTNTSVYETHYMKFSDAYVNPSQVVISNTYSAGPNDQPANAVGAQGQPSPVPHTGWVIKREGTGGRAGRTQYEVLVAMGSLPNT